MDESDSQQKPVQVEYATPATVHIGCWYMVAWLIGGLVVGYFVAVVCGLVLIGGPQGPLPFIFALCPCSAIASVALGRHLRKRKG